MYVARTARCRPRGRLPKSNENSPARFPVTTNNAPKEATAKNQLERGQRGWPPLLLVMARRNEARCNRGQFDHWLTFEAERIGETDHGVEADHEDQCPPPGDEPGRNQSQGHEQCRGGYWTESS